MRNPMTRHLPTRSIPKPEVTVSPQRLSKNGIDESNETKLAFFIAHAYSSLAQKR
jgi:hypothetical protein